MHARSRHGTAPIFSGTQRDGWTAQDTTTLDLRRPYTLFPRLSGSPDPPDRIAKRRADHPSHSVDRLFISRKPPRAFHEGGEGTPVHKNATDATNPRLSLIEPNSKISWGLAMNWKRGGTKEGGGGVKARKGPAGNRRPTRPRGGYCDRRRWIALKVRWRKDRACAKARSWGKRDP